MPNNDENMTNFIDYIELNYKIEDYKSTKEELVNSITESKLNFIYFFSA